MYPLQRIYDEHGVPKRLQSDNGGEFKKEVRQFCRDKKIAMIRSRPYNPKAQDKVERSHRVLRQKIYYDMVRQSKTGINWVQNLPQYMKCLNNDKREELGWKSAFEIYFGRKSNELVMAGVSKRKEPVIAMDTRNATPEDFLVRSQRMKKWNAAARTSGKRIDKRMVDRYNRTNKCSIYEAGDRVFVRLLNRNNKNLTKQKVSVGRIIKRYKSGHRYKVSVDIPDSSMPSIKIVNVEDLADNPQNENRKKMGKYETMKEKRKQLRKKYLIPLTAADRRESILGQGYTLEYDPNGDGDCQFHALSHMLQNVGIHRSADTIRHEIVQYLEQHPYNSEGQPLEYFAGMPWSEYLEEMAQSGTYGDHITINAASNLYNIELEIISSLGPAARTRIQPEFEPTARFSTGHIAEGQGEHFLVLRRCLDEPYETDDETEVEEMRSRKCNDTHKEQRKPDDMPQTPLQQTQTSKYPELPPEIWEKILRYTIQQTNYSWPHHTCRLFSSLSRVNRQFYHIMERLTGLLPRIYCYDPRVLEEQQPGKRIVSLQKLIMRFGSQSGIILELKRIIANPKWNRAWLALVPDAFSWFIIKNIFWRKK